MTFNAQQYFTRFNDFNSHAHVERDGRLIIINIYKKYFNSHAHVERDVWYFRIACQFYISTHTLTWSVTDLSKVVFPVVIISTHTLTWSVTFQMMKKL